MKHYNPVLESVSPDVGSSFTCLKYHRDENIKSNFWHYHPEIELIFVHKGSGKRQIGSNISYFTDDFEISVGENEIFVLGDNRVNSLDSRELGCFKIEDVLSKKGIILFPFNHMKGMN